jgi:Zn-dependent protease
MDSSLVVFFVVTVLWVFSVCLHEFGHAWVAYRGGDYTVAEKGYLTMNPLRYTDPIFSILMPVVFMALGGIGLPGGAVYIDRSLLRSREWSTAVSLAGPATNIILILILGLAFKTGLIPPDSSKVLTISMAFLMQLQVSALLLNLLPVPPLDGFQALAPWMRPDTRERLYSLSNVGLFILFLALWRVEPLNHAFWNVVYWVCDGLGVDNRWGYLGYRAFRFWEH